MGKVKYTLLFFLASCFLLLNGCNAPSSSNFSWYDQNGKVKVLTTTAMIGDLVCEIGGARVDHTTLIQGDVDPHSYELVKGDDEKIAFAHIAIGNGLNLEHGASLRYQMENHPHVVYLGEEIQKRVPEQILYTDGELDPHVWMDISLWAEGVDSIVDALVAQDPEHAAYYRERGDSLRSKMLATHCEIQQEFQLISEDKRYLVTSHDAFHYFARAYLAKGEKWQDRCVAPEGLAPEGQLSSSDIQRVIDHLYEYNIKVVFPESNIARGALKKIIASCQNKGLEVQICTLPLYGDAMGHPGSGADSYLGMIRHNAKVLKGEWEK